jgi:hypothetical protein
MIKFEMVDTAEDFESLKAYAEVENEHIDEVNDKVEGVGVWYNCLNFNNPDGEAIRDSVIWDEVSKKVWRISDTEGDLVFGEPRTNKFIQYCLKQWERLLQKNLA